MSYIRYFSIAGFVKFLTAGKSGSNDEWKDYSCVGVYSNKLIISLNSTPEYGEVVVHSY